MTVPRLDHHTITRGATVGARQETIPTDRGNAIGSEPISGRDPPAGSREALHRRTLELWPRLDRRVLGRCGNDAHRIARHVSHRTSLSVEVIQALIERQPATNEDEGRLWFG